MIAAVAMVVALVSFTPVADVTPATVQAFQRWVAAVDAHEAGQVDESVRTVWSLTVGDRETLNKADPLWRETISMMEGR